ncbi:hypothetical protein BDZ85DRAFT_137331 [Elsinoe ampelina]|uniref:Uncharacterized protein n=1 Tax=Elsinoe ampelina TaxID=302913 RepID=A0A6A6G8M5_9PEZI|nr:hypothetical protein BDZ85DRAFT_137331 [Elsinoe ampelina]
MTFDRIGTVKAVKRHYDLLARAAYLPASDIISPPQDGWGDDDIDTAFLRDLGRSEEVIDLVRHLPYIKNEPKDDFWPIYLESRCVSYLKNGVPMRNVPEVKRRVADPNLGDYGLMPFDQKPPPEFVCLSLDIHGISWLVDTAKGLLYPDAGIFYDHAIDAETAEREPWRSSRAREIISYFDEVYGQIESLALIPVPRGGNQFPSILGNTKGEFVSSHQGAKYN